MFSNEELQLSRVTELSARHKSLGSLKSNSYDLIAVATSSHLQFSGSARLALLMTSLAVGACDRPQCERGFPRSARPPERGSSIGLGPEGPAFALDRQLAHRSLIQS